MLRITEFVCVWGGGVLIKLAVGKNPEAWSSQDKLHLERTLYFFLLAIVLNRLVPFYIIDARTNTRLYYS